MKLKIIPIAVISFLTATVAEISISAPPSFAGILEHMTVRFQSIDNYQCDYFTFTSNDKDTLAIQFDYIFKKPKLIKCVVISKKQQGTVMIYNQRTLADKIYTKSGAFITRFFQNMFRKLYFDIHDPDILDLQRHGLHQSDWNWWINQHQQILPHINAGFLKMDTVFNSQAYLYHILSTNPDSTMSIKEEFIWVDETTLFPIKYEHYDIKGKLIRKHEYRNLVFDNHHITDGIFSIE